MSAPRSMATDTATSYAWQFNTSPAALKPSEDNKTTSPIARRIRTALTSTLTTSPVYWKSKPLTTPRRLAWMKLPETPVGDPTLVRESYPPKFEPERMPLNSFIEFVPPAFIPPPMAPWNAPGFMPLSSPPFMPFPAARSPCRRVTATLIPRDSSACTSTELRPAASIATSSASGLVTRYPSTTSLPMPLSTRPSSTCLLDPRTRTTRTPRDCRSATSCTIP